MTVTTRPQERETLPPESRPACAYEDLLVEIRRLSPRVGTALAAALATEALGAITQAALAPRLYEVVKHG